MTPQQTRLIHIAASQVFGKNCESQYRLLLHNAAGVGSSKQLDNVGFEDVMATLEEMGFADRVHGLFYWRGKVNARGRRGNERMVFKILALARESRYQLPALVGRFSAHRTEDVHQLTPREAWELIEMLKASIAREAKKDLTAEDAEVRGGELFKRPVKVASRDVDPFEPVAGVTYDDDCPF